MKEELILKVKCFLESMWEGGVLVEVYGEGAAEGPLLQ